MKTIFAFLLVSLIINIDEITCKDKVTSEDIDQNTERYLTKSEVATKHTEVGNLYFFGNNLFISITISVSHFFCLIFFC